MRLRTALALIFCLGLTGVSSRSAESAEKTVKAKGKQETYSAVDAAAESHASGDEDLELGLEPPAAPSTANAKTINQTKNHSPGRLKDAVYEIVPQTQVEGVVKRLKLIETIIRKHQRAYDYRALTTRDLEETLRSLNDESAKNHAQ